MSRRIIALSIGYIDPNASPQGGTGYFASESFVTGSGDTPASTFFDGRLSPDITYNMEVRAPFSGYRSATGFGSVTLLNQDGDLDAWLNHQVRDQPVVIKSLEIGQTWSAGTVLATTTADDLRFSGLNDLTISLRDPIAKLDVPLAQEVWVTGGAFEDAAGQVKPVAFGTPLNCKPVAVNFADFRFDCHDEALVDVADVRVDGVSVPYAVVGGGVSAGVRLESEPDGEVLLDPIATGTANILSLNQDSPLPENIIYSNSNRAFQNTSRRYDSPVINYEYTGYVPTGKAASAGGKFYFECLVNRAVQTDATLTPYQYSTAMGIGPVPTATAKPNQADQYTLWTVRSGGFSDRVVTYGDTSIADAVQSASLSGTWENARVGVSVDFDAMTIQFKVYKAGVLKWTSSLMTITANSPLDTFYPIAAVVGSPDADLRWQDNRLTVYPQPENFEQEIPSGFAAWGESAYTVSTAFSDLVTSITDRVSGVTVDTVTQAEIDALAYSYSYYIADTTPAAQLLHWACLSFTGWYYADRTGKLAFGRLAEPGGVGAVTFSDAELISVERVAFDPADGLSNRMGALRNWTVSSRGNLSDTVSASDKAKLTRQFQHEATASTAVADVYASARGGEIIPTLFRVGSNADTEAERLAGLFAVQRNIYVVEVAFDLTTYTSLDLGDSVGVSFSRYGFSGSLDSGAFGDEFDSGFDIGTAGQTFILLGMSGNFASSTMRLTLWG